MEKITMVSIVIPTFNRPILCNKTVRSILDLELENELGIQYEIIVVDDGSEKKNIPSFSQEENVKLVTNKKNNGRAFVRNIGAEVSSGEIIFFFDDDVILKDEKLIAKHIEAYKDDNSTKAIVTNTVSIRNNIDLNSETFVNDIIKSNSRLNLYINSRGANKYTDGSFIKGNYLASAACSFERDFFFKIDKFDEQIDGYGWEDPEIGLRIEKNKGKLLFIKSDGVYHFHDKSIETWSNQLINSGKNFNLMLNKYPEYRERFGSKFFDTIFACMIFNLPIFMFFIYSAKVMKFVPQIIANVILRYIFSASVFRGYKTVRSKI